MSPLHVVAHRRARFLVHVRTAQLLRLFANVILACNLRAPRTAVGRIAQLGAAG
jgi:hypothetical protein